MADERPYFEELVENVQQLQRTNPEGKLKWMSYAIQNGNGRYDPKYHTQEYLLDFFEKLEADEIEIDPSVRGAPGPLVRNEVFVGGLPQDVDESEIQAYFSEWGQVTKVEYKDGRGFCFVTLATEEEVNGLLEHHDEHYIREAFIDVKRAEDRRKGGKSNGKGKGKSGGKGGGKGGKKGGKSDGKGASGGKGSSFGGYRARDDSHNEPPAKKVKGGKSSGGFSKGGSKGSSKGAPSSKGQQPTGDSWGNSSGPSGGSKGKSSSGGKGASSKGASGGKGGGSGGYQKTQSYSTPSKAGKEGGKGGKGGAKGGKGKGGKRSSPY